MTAVKLWQVSSDPRFASFTYRVARGFGHSLLGQIVAGTFRALRVSAAINNSWWWAIHDQPNVSAFEIEHGVDAERSSYNTRQFSEVRRTGKPSLGRHAGYFDWFVPIVAKGQQVATLVAGPFAKKRPTATDVVEQWRSITGRQGHPADPEFATYLSAALGTLVLEGQHTRMFGELLSCFAALIAGEGRADALANRADALRVELEKLRFVDRVWDAVREMVDDRSTRTWHGAYRVYGLSQLGLPRVADHALVGLTVSRAAGADPVDEAVRRDALQRKAVELARATGWAIAGRVGDHGVVFLSAASGSAQKTKQRLVDLSDRVTGLARRFGLSLYFGVSAADPSAPLSRSYHAALGAAESALIQGKRLEFVEPGASHRGHSLRDLRKEIGRSDDERQEARLARFDHYLEAVALECSFRVDAARGYLEAGFERLTEALLAAGGLGERSYRALCDRLDRATDAARTMRELLAAYRRAAADVSEAIAKPVEAHHDRSLESAVDYIRQHYTEPLGVVRVAKVAGFAPNYFSKLFRARERTTFSLYVAGLRVERAKQLLTSTELAATRIAEMCGFRSSQYFSRVFGRATGTTPIDYRRRPGARKTRTPRG
jgi:AraC-like DNA-binding protein